MSCQEFQINLSEYIDGVLDRKARVSIESHLKTCADCREELRALRALSDELGALEQMKTPVDFLDQVHDRIEKASPLNRTLKKLFKPLYLKVPLEAAAVVATAVLVFSIWHTERVEIGTERAPMYLKEELGSEKPISDTKKLLARRQPLKSPPRREIQKEEPVSFKSESVDVLEKGKSQVPIELVLMLRPHKHPLSAASGMEKKDKLPGLVGKALGPESRVREEGRPSSMKEAARAPKKEMVTALEPLIHAVGGVVTATTRDDTDTLEAKIPASKYEDLLRALKDMGSLKDPPVIRPEGEGEHLLIRIRLIN